MSGPVPEREPEYGRCWPVTGNTGFLVNRLGRQGSGTDGEDTQP